MKYLVQKKAYAKIPFVCFYHYVWKGKLELNATRENKDSVDMESFDCERMNSKLMEYGMKRNKVEKVWSYRSRSDKEVWKVYCALHKLGTGNDNKGGVR